LTALPLFTANRVDVIEKGPEINFLSIFLTVLRLLLVFLVMIRVSLPFEPLYRLQSQGTHGIEM
jgi:hypothetical protein